MAMCIYEDRTANTKTEQKNATVQNKDRLP